MSVRTFNQIINKQTLLVMRFSAANTTPILKKEGSKPLKGDYGDRC
jgi:hypothetical protein